LESCRGWQTQLNDFEKYMKIILLSDVVRHVYLQPVEDAIDEKRNEYKVYTQNMNVEDGLIVCPPIIKQMIIKATGMKPDNISPSYKFEKKPDIPKLTLVRALKKYPQAAKSDKKEVWRVDQGAEYFGSDLTLVDADGINASASGCDPMKTLFDASMPEADADANLLVLCDRKAELREYIKNNRNNIKTLVTKFKGTGKAIVIGIKEGVKDQDWLEELAKSLSCARENCIMILTADDLRSAGLNITEHGTIEQNIREIIGYLDEDPLKTIWNKICDHLVVIFRETQVLYLNKDNHGSYHSCPHFDRPAQIRPLQFGKMPGKFTILMTSIIKYLNVDSGSDVKAEDIESALRFGVSAYSQYFKKGYCSGRGCNPFNAITEAVNKVYDNPLYENSFKEKEFFISSLEVNICLIKNDITEIKGNLTHEKWSRSDALFDYYNKQSIDYYNEQPIDYYKKQQLKIIGGLEPGPEKTRKLEKFVETFVLHKIVTDGLETVTHKPSLNKSVTFADYKIICPHLELGAQEDITIIDEDHMNGFIDLTQLIRTYLGSHNKSEQPLCIAVFGPPGEGKSFSIKKIIKHISPERKSEDKTFNLAQFNTIDQLTEAFHQIQDCVLKHLAEPPLVIFDEFDANFEAQPLGWLKYFLAPMQDDLFHGKSGDYKVGRAIFVFSGGTSKSFQEFQDKLKDDPDEKAAVKLNDFIGRLRGFMDVKGVNSDVGYISRIVKLRRAILLHSLLNRHAEHILSSDGKSAHIHTDVIDAFLEAKEYKFGIRSMEAIIQMSKWIDKEFVPASLPSLNQLKMHVDPQAFQKVLFRNKT
jgi:hypothetical protein